MTSLLLKRASASRSSGEWSESDYDVLADGVVIGRIMRAAASAITKTARRRTGYEATREAAMAAFAKSWRCK